MLRAIHQERLAKIEDLREEILAAGDEAQKIRKLPTDIVTRLVDEGFFRFALPTELGGEDASSMETIEILEHMAAIDASVAWNVMLGSEINAMAAGGMDPELAKEIYIDNPRVVMCGGGGPGSTPPRAERQPDGSVKVWGQTTFISGCHNADYCFMGAPLMKGDEPDLDENGQMVFKLWLLPRDQFEIVETWDVAGLRGSGSDDAKADGAVVPAKYTGIDLWSLPAHYPNPVYRMPTALRLAYNKAAIALGVAKGSLEVFADIAKNKIPMLSSTSLAKRGIAQYRMGVAEAMYRSCRAFLMEAMEAVEDELRDNDKLPGAKTTQDARLACTHAANECMKVVDLLHNTAGTTGMRMHSPLERKLRDAHGAATHRWVAHPLYEDLGSILLGNEPSPEFAGGLSTQIGPPPPK
ncbi:MAG: acyl-CoA dehydrogenase family protein [Proteobacteria bacterium]|nr:acyl-CoA dehydrogenase family protein [Pseudomonadota bacterium]